MENKKMGPSTSLRLFRHCRTAHPADINPQNGVLNPPHHIICTFDFFTCSTMSMNVASVSFSTSLFISMKRHPHDEYKQQKPCQHVSPSN